MEPLIGITAAYEDTTDRAMLHLGYIEAIEKAGGIPVVLYSKKIPKLDGIILSGGGDVTPMLYGQKPAKEVTSCQYERDILELNIINQTKGIPTLGICRGMQILNVYYGGELIQHIDGHNLNKNERHEVTIKEASMLRYIINKSEIQVNSLHHQVVGKLGSGLVANATCDGYIEGFENDEKNILGLQWHPEKMESQSSDKIFEHFIYMCKNASKK